MYPLVPYMAKSEPRPICKQIIGKLFASGHAAHRLAVPAQECEEVTAFVLSLKNDIVEA